MGIAVTLYRARIGSFEAGLKAGTPKIRESKYNPQSVGNDIHYRSIVTGICLVLIALTSFGVVAVKHYLIERYAATALDSSILKGAVAEIKPETQTITASVEMYGGLYVSYFQKLLVLVNDVELNPGPSEDTQMILKAIQDTNLKLANDIGKVKDEIIDVKTEVKGVKSEISSIKQMVKNVETRQTQLEKRVSTLEGKFEILEHHSEIIQNDIAHIAYTDEREQQRLGDIERRLNAIETEKVKCSLRLFGLQEADTESENLLSQINEKVLCVATADDNLDPSCITSAKRVGTYRRDKSRMVIVKFGDFDSKMKLFKYRDELRTKGIRISNDLTYVQRKQLQDLNNNGYQGYFKNGELYKRPKEANRNGNPPRVFKTAASKSGSIQKGSASRPEEIEVDDTDADAPNNDDV